MNAGCSVVLTSYSLPSRATPPAACSGVGINCCFQISDRFGRKKAFLFGMFASAVFSIGTAIVAQYSISLFALGRFLFLLFIHGSTIVTFVYGAEMIHPKWRTTLGIATMSGFQLGYIFHRFWSLPFSSNCVGFVRN